jgi:hypothetical protein
MPEDRRSDDDYVEKLRGAPRIPHDPDERPTREDKQPGQWQQIFNFPVKVPRRLTPKRLRRDR